jgi:holo-[acyl-carrier protein] synthase
MRANPMIDGDMSLQSTEASWGLDLVELADVARSLDAFGDRYLRRLFADGERAAWPRFSVPESRLICCALGFAAKEATLKALDLADRGINWRDIEARFHGRQVVSIHLHGRARSLADAAGYGAWRVTSSLSSGHAMALVFAHKSN